MVFRSWTQFLIFEKLAAECRIKVGYEVILPHLSNLHRGRYLTEKVFRGFTPSLNPCPVNGAGTFMPFLEIVCL